MSLMDSLFDTIPRYLGTKRLKASYGVRMLKPHHNATSGFPNLDFSLAYKVQISLGTKVYTAFTQVSL